MVLEYGVNSYIKDIDEADSIVENEYFSGDEEYKIWESLVENDKIKLIIKGTRILDNEVWLGYKHKQWSPLSWPRVVYGKLIECPDDVKIAVIKNMLKEQKYKGTDYADYQHLINLGVSKYKVKDAEVNFATSNIDGSKADNNKINGIYTDIYNTYLSKWLA